MTSQIGYLKLLISRSILSGTLDFEIKRVTCIVFVLAISKISRLYLAAVAEQAGSSLTWSEIYDDRFSHLLADTFTLEVQIKRKLGFLVFSSFEKSNCEKFARSSLLQVKNSSNTFATS